MLTVFSILYYAIPRRVLLIKCPMNIVTVAPNVICFGFESIDLSRNLCSSVLRTSMKSFSELAITNKSSMCISQFYTTTLTRFPLALYVETNLLNDILLTTEFENNLVLDLPSHICLDIFSLVVQQYSL